MRRIVHLIPYDAIGGVEIAARSVPTGRHDKLHFERQYLVQGSGENIQPVKHHELRLSPNDPRAYWYALWRLYRDPPDLLLASLWRSALVLICIKVLRPKTRGVVFLHAAQPTHLLDRWINRIAIGLSDAVWADSHVTLEERVSPRFLSKAKVISFLVERRPIPTPRNPTPKFVFWGRISAQKGLDRALRLFADVVRQKQDALFTVIGPDGGMQADLTKEAELLGILDRVVFKGALSHEEIAREADKASFYLQTSLFEGMAMSVIEGMQKGLVPVVTPVGEISRYCHDGQNAIIVGDLTEAVNEVLAILSDPDRYKIMSAAAAKHWQTQTLYRDDLLMAAKQLLEDEYCNV